MTYSPLQLWYYRSWFNWRRYRPSGLRADLRDYRYLHQLKKERNKVGRCPDRHWDDGTSNAGIQCSFPLNHPDHEYEGDICHMDLEHGGGFGWINDPDDASVANGEAG